MLLRTPHIVKDFKHGAWAALFGVKILYRSGSRQPRHLYLARFVGPAAMRRIKVLGTTRYWSNRHGIDTDDTPVRRATCR